MAEKNGDAQNVPWPVPAFHFLVTIDGIAIPFQEVSGLDTEYDVVEYRSANNPKFTAVNMPGMKKTSDITLKKGMFRDDTALSDYLASVKMNAVAPKTITISLIDQENKVLFAWTLKNAFPKKVTGISMNARSGDVAIEEIVLAHEGLTMTKV